MQLLHSKLYLLIILLALWGCSNSKQVMDKEISLLRTKSIQEDSLEKLRVKESSKNYLLYSQELGRIYFINGEPAKSLTYFNQSINYYNSLDEQASINVGGVTRGILSSTVGNDNNMRYTGADFERSLNYFYNAVNYLRQNKPQEAMVDIRASSDIQKFALAKREKKVMQAEESASDYRFSGEIDDVLRESETIRNGPKKRFLNPYIYYISGNIRELLGDTNGALVDYKLALELNNKNSYLIQDTLRLSKFSDSSYYNQLKKTTTVKEVDSSTYKQTKTVLVVYEQGFVPPKSDVTGKVFIWGGNVFTVSLPAYNMQQEPLNNTNIQVIQKDKMVISGQTEEIANIYLLAKNDLAEHYNSILLRQISRMTTKTAMQNAGRNNDSKLGNAIAAVGIISSIVEKADVRSFRTLPSYVQVAKLNIKEDFNSLKVIINHGKEITIDDIDLKNGEEAIVYIIDTNDSLYYDIVYKGKK